MLVRCDQCGMTLRHRRATVERPYHYELSGLKNVQLSGIDVVICAHCQVEAPILPRMSELHRVIAKHIMAKEGCLLGDEVRFLRKISGMMAKDFAAKICIDASTLSRIETGKQPVGPGTDKLVRLVAMAAVNMKETRRLLLKDGPSEAKVKWEITLQPSDSGWSEPPKRASRV